MRVSLRFHTHLGVLQNPPLNTCDMNTHLKLRKKSCMQQSDFEASNKSKKEHGGSLLEGKRKGRRALSTKHAIHLVLKSDLKGVFNPGNRRLEQLIQNIAVRFHVPVYSTALNWSHIHCVIKIKDRKDYNAFIRVLTSILALRIRKHKNFTGKIFTLPPFTRILSWGRDFKNVLSYLVINQHESFGLLVRPKKNKRKKKEPAPT